MRTRTNRVATVALAAAAAVLLTGCQNSADADGDPAVPAAASATPSAADNGVAALTADQILARARTALGGAPSYRINGTMNNDGQRATLDVTARGRDLSGAMAMGPAKVQLLAVGGQQYMKPNEQFWALMGDPKKAKDIAKLVGDRWVKVPADDKNLAGLFSVASVGEVLDNSGTVTKGPTKKIDGVPAVGLVDDGTDGGTLYIATVGEPYPLRIEAPTAGDGRVDFSDFGAAIPELTAPAEADVIDFVELAR
ncbi:hypothetical protein [Jidongwangia harbinensis]|uniref:hypothetical protein n=1 Tax=Jidongwangia harbinensis TaxID=2878561 RepID=UPI001CD92E83|nr:hypothetical protein [Jidongwangia harbinensis]MCA2216703.1 hypothetical protein [Jidongwangia harbinensis]